MYRMMLHTAVFMFSMGAAAELLPDVLCRPVNVADRGYEVEATGTSENGYSGILKQISFYGEVAKYQGVLKLEMVNPSPNCVVKITNLSDSPTGAFEMNMFEHGDGQLVRVNGSSVEERDAAMACRSTTEFAADLKRLCRGGQ